MNNRGRYLYRIALCSLALSLVGFGCRGGDGAEGTPGKAGPAGKTARGSGSEGGRFAHGGNRGGGETGVGSTAVPVEVSEVQRRDVSSFLETNGTLEAENEVDIVARTQGPVVELAVEEGMRVEKGQLLVRLDDTEPRAQLEIAKVALEEATRTYERAKASLENEIISQELYDQALAQFESAQAQVMGSQILYDYTKVVAPFDAVVIERAIKHAENVTANQRLFRISDFDPLLCPIQVPERELSRLRVGQRALVEVEAWPGETFAARVLRISPIVDATTGTIKVTLHVNSRAKLSPGMFASVFLVVDTHNNAVVMPKRALSLESLSDMVFVAVEGVAERREVELGFEENEFVEVVDGLSPGDRVIVVGQDGLTDATPIQVLNAPEGSGKASPAPAVTADEGKRQGPSAGGPPRRGGNMGPGGQARDLSKMTPEQIERMKKRMRDRGMSDEEIDAAIERRRGQSNRN